MTENESRNAVTAALASLEAILKEGPPLDESERPIFTPIRKLQDKLSHLIKGNSNNEDLLASLKEVDHALQEFSNQLISDMRKILP